MGYNSFQLNFFYTVVLRNIMSGISSIYYEGPGSLNELGRWI